MDIATKILIRRTIADSITGVSEKKGNTVINIWLLWSKLNTGDINVTIPEDNRMIGVFLD